MGVVLAWPARVLDETFEIVEECECPACEVIPVDEDVKEVEVTGCFVWKGRFRSVESKCSKMFSTVEGDGFSLALER